MTAAASVSYVSAGERLREMSHEISHLSYLLPDSARSWEIVASLQTLLSDAQTLVKHEITLPASVTSSYVETTDLNSLLQSADKQSGKPAAKSAFKIHVHQESSTLTAVKQSDSHTDNVQAPAVSASTVFHSIDEMVPPNKIQRTEYLPIRHMGLDNIAQAVDQITRTQHGVLPAATDQQTLHSNYVSAAANSTLFTHNLVSQQQHAAGHTMRQSQQQQQQQASLLAAETASHHSSAVSAAATAAAVSATPHHSLISSMSNPNMSSLNMTSILPDNYQLSANIMTSVTGAPPPAASVVTAGHMYGQIQSHITGQQHPNRHYIELQPAADSIQQQVFILKTNK